MILSKKQCSSLVIFLLLESCGFLACRNYIGNPHRVRQAPRVVSIMSTEIKVKPSLIRIPHKSDTIQVEIEMDEISEFNVSLSKHRGISIISSIKSSDTCQLKIRVSKKTKPGKIHFLISREKEEHYAAFLILPAKTEKKG